MITQFGFVTIVIYFIVLFMFDLVLESFQNKDIKTIYILSCGRITACLNTPGLCLSQILVFRTAWRALGFEYLVANVGVFGLSKGMKVTLMWPRDLCLIIIPSTKSNIYSLTTSVILQQFRYTFLSTGIWSMDTHVLLPPPSDFFPFEMYRFPVLIYVNVSRSLQALDIDLLPVS